jgi:phosphoglycolate phosphatase-like HAD superfamily hydrolase
VDRHQADHSDGAGRAHAAGRELIALDLDGTLIDARLRQVGVAAEALQSVCGAELDEDAFWALKREGANTADALVRMGFSPPVASSVAERWAARIESEEWLARDLALPGAVHAVASLPGPVVVLTARRRAEGATLSLRSAGLLDHVDSVVVVNPARAVAEKARALADGGAVAFVGDTTSDGEAARLADVPFTAVDTGQRSAEYLRAAGFAVAGTLGAALRDLGLSPAP